MMDHYFRFWQRLSTRGMTILEVLMATMLLAVVAAVVFTAFGLGLRAAALAAGMNTATSLAEEALARMTASPCGSSFRQTIPPQPEDPRLARYRREVTARRLPGANLWELTATVYWVQERRERSVTLTTLRYISSACEFVGQ
jgi:prepilin-type N-terminal cleavage/methylation domain-containing protein